MKCGWHKFSVLRNLMGESHGWHPALTIKGSDCLGVTALNGMLWSLHVKVWLNFSAIGKRHTTSMIVLYSWSMLGTYATWIYELRMRLRTSYYSPLWGNVLNQPTTCDSLRHHHFSHNLLSTSPNVPLSIPSDPLCKNNLSCFTYYQTQLEHISNYFVVAKQIL